MPGLIDSSIAFGDELIMKLLRRAEAGINPGVEIGRFLAEHVRFAATPALAGSLELRPDRSPVGATTLVTVEEFVPNEGDGWSYVVDALHHGLEEALARHESDDVRRMVPATIMEAADAAGCDPHHPLIGPHCEWSDLLGRRTAELHKALASAGGLPAFTPEPFTAMDRQAMYHSARSLLKRTLRMARVAAGSELVQQVLGREEEILERLRTLSAVKVTVQRIRCHGDYHLGQVLWTGKDLVLIDFEGEPSRPLTQRRF